MNKSYLKYCFIVVLVGLSFGLIAQHFYLGLGYSSMNPKSTVQGNYYQNRLNIRLEQEFILTGQYEKKFGKGLGLSFYLNYVHNTNKNVIWIDPRYHPQINPLQLPLRYSFNNISHLLSACSSVNLDLIKIKKSTWGIAPYFNAGFLFKKQTQPVIFDDFKFSTHTFKPFNLEAYPLMYGRISRFNIQLGARVYSLKYFDDVVELKQGESKPPADNRNPFKLMANMAYRL